MTSVFRERMYFTILVKNINKDKKDIRACVYIYIYILTLRFI